MAFVEDFTVFFADFGVLATPVLGEAVTVIFDRAQIQALNGEITATGPVALAVSADVADWVPHETQLTIAATAGTPEADYILRDTQPDGTGLTLLILEVDQ
jgi:hypothetical protein